MTALRRERDCLARSAERLPEPSEHHKVRVEGDLGESTHSERGEAVVELQVAERSLDGCAATVEVAPALRMPWNAREQPPAERERQGALIGLRATERDDGFAAALLALGVDTGVVVALVGRARLGAEAASVERVEQRRDVEGVVAARCL